MLAAKTIVTFNLQIKKALSGPFHVRWVPCHHNMALHNLRLQMEEMASIYGGQL